MRSEANKCPGSWFKVNDFILCAFLVFSSMFGLRCEVYGWQCPISKAAPKATWEDSSIGRRIEIGVWMDWWTDRHSRSNGSLAKQYTNIQTTRSVDTSNITHRVDLKPTPSAKCMRQVTSTIYFENSTSQLFIFCGSEIFCTSFGESDHDAEWMRSYIYLCRYQKQPSLGFFTAVSSSNLWM